MLAVASKVVSFCENRIIPLRRPVSAQAERHAKRWNMDPRLASIVLREADVVMGGVDGFMLTLKDGVLTANAGVDIKNSPPDTATLWPKNADRSARRLRDYFQSWAKARVGVEIVDSRVTPLRLGTIGLAIGVAGFQPITDHRKRRDLFGRGVRVTRSNIADDLAAAAHLLMGETMERVGAVIIRGAPVELGDGSSKRTKMRRSQCLIGRNIALKPAIVDRTTTHVSRGKIYFP